MKNTTIHGSPITAAYKSEYDSRLTRVWCKDGSLHLVTGYERTSEGWGFDSVVGYFEMPDGLWYGKSVIEKVTRPAYLNA